MHVLIKIVFLLRYIATFPFYRKGNLDFGHSRHNPNVNSTFCNNLWLLAVFLSGHAVKWRTCLSILEVRFRIWLIAPSWWCWKKVANNLDKQSFPKLFSWGEVKGRWAESGAAAYERSQDAEAQLAKARGAKNCPTHLKGLDDGVKFPWGQNVLIFGQHWPLRRKGGQSNHPALRLMPLLPKRCRMLLAGWSKSFKHTWNEMKQTFQL